MVIEPKIRGFLCTTAHPEGCRAGVEEQMADHAWSSYQHQFAGNASRAARTADDVDFDSPLMRLATGGGPAPAKRVA